MVEMASPMSIHSAFSLENLMLLEIAKHLTKKLHFQVCFEDGVANEI